jgi:uncharacterized protein YlxP (DUF503 family)
MGTNEGVLAGWTVEPATAAGESDMRGYIGRLGCVGNTDSRPALSGSTVGWRLRRAHQEPSPVAATGLCYRTRLRSSWRTFMFVGIARLTLSFPSAHSLKEKRQTLRKITERTKAKFNVAIAEVGDNDLWQRGLVGIAVVGNEQGFVEECLNNVLHFIEDSYLAPVLDRQTELLPFGSDHLGQPGVGHGGLRIDSGNRTLAEAEGLTGDAADEWNEEEEDETL